MAANQWKRGQLLKKGSVKDIHAVECSEDLLFFSYSDRYSVFDWGAMPDELEGKGEALSYMAWTFFRLLGDPRFWQRFSLEVEGEMEKAILTNFREKGMPHHAVSRPEDNGLLVRKIDVHEPPFNEKSGEWDYSAYREKKWENALVPLEFVFRFGVPAGSSLLKRLNSDYLQTLGLDSSPQAGSWLEREIIEMSTKLESTDRYLLASEAKMLSGLTDIEYSRLTAYTRLVSRFIKSLFESRGLEVWDGKLELAFNRAGESGERDFLMVDSIGPDELRLMFPGQNVPLSKEILRQVYRGSEWAKNVELAKTQAKERGMSDWKSICLEELGSKPAPLPGKTKEAVSMLYLSLANELAAFAEDDLPFPQAKSLAQVVEDFMNFV